MALVPLATKGNYFHVYDFRVKPGRGDEFVELFNKFDYGDNNPFHRSRAQVKDGVLCRDAADPDHFYLIGEWADIEEHRRIREFVAREIKPEFVQLIVEGVRSRKGELHRDVEQVLGEVGKNRRATTGRPGCRSPSGPALCAITSGSRTRSSGPIGPKT